MITPYGISVVGSEMPNIYISFPIKIINRAATPDTYLIDFPSAFSSLSLFYLFTSAVSYFINFFIILLINSFF